MPPGMSFVGQEHFRPRTDLLPLIPATAQRVLDVGCGPGLTGAALLARGTPEVWGLERDAALAAQARTRLTNVVSADADANEEAGLPKGYFDVLLYADVLEHMLDPWTTLQRHRELLSAGGRIVASIPNVRHFRVVAPLVLRARWTYTDEGLLSVGHVRFFTTRTMRQLIHEAGYRIVEERANYSGRAGLVRRLTFGRLDDFFAIQRLFVAEPR